MNFFLANDGGGANQIFSLAKTFKDDEITVLAFGPAQDIAKGLGLKFKEDSFPPSQNDQVYLGASASSVMTRVELTTSRWQTNRNFFTFGFLDGWQSFESRWPSLFIDEYFVTDQYALTVAKECFPGSKVNLVPNYYLDQCKFLFRESLISLKNLSRENNVLYLSQPLLNQDPSNQCICSELQLLVDLSPDVVYVRDHPRSNSTYCIRYHKFTRENLKVIALDKNEPIGLHMAYVERVAGPATYALFLANQIGLSTFLTRDYPRDWRGPHLGEKLFC